MDKFATLDIGTNSTLIHIAGRDSNGNWHELADRSIITRLGEGLKESGVLSRKAMERTENAIQTLLTLAREHDVRNVAAVGTMALREALNGKEFLDFIRKTCHLNIEVIGGDTEALLTFLAVVSNLDFGDRRFIIFNIGGGSTEFIMGQHQKIQHQKSINLGALHLTNDFFKTDPVTVDEFGQMQADVDSKLANLTDFPNANILIGSGGTMTNLAAVKLRMEPFVASKIQGLTLNQIDLSEQLHMFKSRTISERKQIVGLHPQRAETILAGCSIAFQILDKFQLNELVVSDRGIRHGLLLHRFGRSD